MALALALLIAPVTAVVAGIFLDDVAEVVEKRGLSRGRPGQGPARHARGTPVGQVSAASCSCGNIVALILLLVPGINIAAFFLVNGYLLGREYFEFAAMRFRAGRGRQADAAQHSTTVFLAGPGHRRLPGGPVPQPC